MNVNHAFESLVGKNKNLIVGTPITQYIHPDYQDSFYLHFKTLNRLEHSESIELALLNTQNGEVFVKIQCSRDEVIDNDNEASKLIRMSVTDISGLKEKEAALAKSYQLLNDLAVQSKTFAWEVDANGLYTYVSPVITEVLGYHPSELEYKLHFYDLFPLGNKSYLMKDILHNFSNKKPFVNYVNEVVNKFGRNVWVSTNGMPVLNEHGELLGYRGSDTDITRRKLAEDQLALLKYAIDSSSVGVSISDVSQPDMPLIFINKAFREITGYEIEEVLGKNCRFLQNDDKDQPELQELRAAIKEGRNSSVVIRNYKKDGTLFWNHLTMSPIYNSNQQLTHFVGIQKDITDLKIAQTQLLDSEERFRNLFVNNASPMYLIDALTGKFIDANQAALTFYGWDKLDFLRKNLQQICITTGSMSSEEILLKANGRFECKHFKSNGRLYDVEVFSSVITVNGRELVHQIIHDITERNRYLLTIETHNKLLKEIAWTQSHVVRAPLSRMMGLVNLLEYENFSTPDLPKLLEAIIRSANELDDIIREISQKTYAINANYYDTNSSSNELEKSQNPKND
ncbi:MAG TPA: hypothetical protein DCL43_02860 [Chitinophagaceae bacterium]|nr:hypothetical protein [Chitinophagaceae bacterium]